MEPLDDITLVAAGIALALLIVEAGLWIGARRGRRPAEVEREEATRTGERRADA